MYVPLADDGHACAVKLHRTSRSMLHATVASSLGKNKFNPDCSSASLGSQGLLFSRSFAIASLHFVWT